MRKSAAHIRAQLAYGSRRDVGYSPDVLAGLRRDYHAARMVEKVRRLVREAGPLTPEQSTELAEIIRCEAVEVAA